MTVESNKRLAREAIQIWTTGDLGAADELYASDYVNPTSITTPTIPVICTGSRR
jgi:ketosteroid isomerase-like protein